MSNNRTSIIAFLSGLGSDFTNTNPPGSSNTNTNPPGSSNTNTNPGGKSAGTTHTDPPGSPAPPKLPFSFDPRALQSWEGLDAPWAYSSEETLMMQALRKSRSKITRMSDQKAVARNPKKEPLWRWAPEFRSEAVSGELHSRLQVHGRTVWLVEPPSANAKRPGLSAQRLIDVPTLAELEAAAPKPGAKPGQGYVLDEQIDSVMRAAIEREDRLPEILVQTRGLWPFFESITGVQLDRAPAFFDLLIAVEGWMLRTLMQLKHTIAAPRPVQVSSLVMPLIDTPGHGSLPSGHAAQAAFNAEMLGLLLYFDETGQALVTKPERIELLDRFARRVAFNRVVAGVHFPVDNLVGYWLGRQLALAVAALAEPANPMHELHAVDIVQLARGDFRLKEVLPAGRPPMPMPKPALRPPSEAPTLAVLWARARAELSGV
jgi:membrane-associated phospholipid phosphatase